MQNLPSSLTPFVKKRIAEWLDGPVDISTKKEILRLLKKNPQALEDAFFQDLSFGTGGIRALMGVGTNRLNVYTVQRIAQGLANYLLQRPRKTTHRVVIGFDCRHHSSLFAKWCARVLAANGIEAYLFSALRPTPLLSFACIYYHASAGVMVTASHNPPEYNGIKIYGEDGAQLVTPHDLEVVREVNAIETFSQIKTVQMKHPLIQKIGKNLDGIYCQTTEAMQNYPKENISEGKNLNIIYTNLHGAGITLVPQALKDWGFPSVSLVKKQVEVNGDFPFAPLPNPEEKDSLQLGVEELIRKKKDLLLATDPDADRVGVVVRHKGKAVLFSGHQVACLCLHHLLEADVHVRDHSAFIKTIVTTELFRRIAESFGKPCFDVLTGFKYIAEKIREWEKGHAHSFLFGAEESCGYLLGSFVRDKDGVSTCCLLAEMALHLKKEKKTLYDQLLFLYKTYGVFREKLSTLSFPDSKEGMQRMKETMRKLRKDPPKSFLGKKVILLEDFTKDPSPLPVPNSDVLRFWLEDGTKLVVRPSGTEAKIKLYAGVERKDFSDLFEAIEERDLYLEKLTSSFQTRLG